MQKQKSRSIAAVTIAPTGDIAAKMAARFRRPAIQCARLSGQEWRDRNLCVSHFIRLDDLVSGARRRSTSSRLIADKKNLYVVEPLGSANAILALDAKPAHKLWRASLPAKNVLALAVDTSRLYVVEGGTGVYALNVKSGKQLWSFIIDNGNMFVGGQATVEQHATLQRWWGK